MNTRLCRTKTPLKANEKILRNIFVSNPLSPYVAPCSGIISIIILAFQSRGALHREPPTGSPWELPCERDFHVAPGLAAPGRRRSSPRAPGGRGRREFSPSAPRGEPPTELAHGRSHWCSRVTHPGVLILFERRALRGCCQCVAASSEANR